MIGYLRRCSFYISLTTDVLVISKRHREGAGAIDFWKCVGEKWLAQVRRGERLGKMYLKRPHSTHIMTFFAPHYERAFCYWLKTSSLYYWLLLQIWIFWIGKVYKHIKGDKPVHFLKLVLPLGFLKIWGSSPNYLLLFKIDFAQPNIQYQEQTFQ